MAAKGERDGVWVVFLEGRIGDCGGRLDEVGFMVCHAPEQPKIEKNKFPFWGP